MFTRAACSIRVFHEARRARDFSCRFERFVRADLRFVLLRAFFHVGLHVKLTPGPEQSSDLVQQIGIHDEALRVLLFPPRIGKVQEERVDRSIRAKPSEGLARIRIEHTRACSEALFAQSFVDNRRPLQTNLQTEQPTIGRNCSPFEEKSSTPRADLDLDRAFSRQERSDVDVSFTGKTSSMRIGMIGSRLKHHDGRKTSTLTRSWVALAVISSPP